MLRPVGNSMHSGTITKLGKNPQNRSTSKASGEQQLMKRRYMHHAHDSHSRSSYRERQHSFRFGLHSWHLLRYTNNFGPGSWPGAPGSLPSTIFLVLSTLFLRTGAKGPRADPHFVHPWKSVLSTLFSRGQACRVGHSSGSLVAFWFTQSCSPKD